MSNGVIYTHLMKMMASGGESAVAQLYLSCKIHCEESSQYKKFSAKGEMKECLAEKVDDLCYWSKWHHSWLELIKILRLTKRRFTLRGFEPHVQNPVSIHKNDFPARQPSKLIQNNCFQRSNTQNKHFTGACVGNLPKWLLPLFFRGEASQITAHTM